VHMGTKPKNPAGAVSDEFGNIAHVSPQHSGSISAPTRMSLPPRFGRDDGRFASPISRRYARAMDLTTKLNIARTAGEADGPSQATYIYIERELHPETRRTEETARAIKSPS
jgi:hypothetical protein